MQNGELFGQMNLKMSGIRSRHFFCFVLTLMLTVVMDAGAADSDFTLSSDGTITNYTGWDTVLIIPAAISGRPVTAIGEGAFKGVGLTSVTIPAGVRVIGADAFRDNKLTSITIAAGVREIKDNAFRGNKLTQVTIPGTVKTIAGGVFADNQLAEVTISPGVTDILGSAFENNKLTRIVIPKGVTTIGGNVFKGNKLTSITLPSSIQNLGSDKFINFSWVHYTVGGEPAVAILPDYIVCSAAELSSSLGPNIYYNYIANNMKAGTYTGSMRCDNRSEGDFDFRITQYGAVLTAWKGKENRIRIPSELGGVAVKAIGAEVFIKKGLDNILIPEGITVIEDSAFSSNNLISLTIPDSVTHIRNDAFSSNKLTSITIPNSVTSIGWTAFSSNKLTSVTIPDSVIYIGGSAFSFNQLTSITIGPNVKCDRYSFPDSFVDVYKGVAGSYASNTSGTWTKR